jgi:hypothetical protein
MAVLGQRIAKGIEGYVADVAKSIGEELVPTTPVKTGLARGNWRPSLRVPVSAATSLADPTGRATIARIASVGNQYRLGETMFITNHLPYIRSLNAGSSPQAPAGFVEAAVERGLEKATRRREEGLIRGN